MTGGTSQYKSMRTLHKQAVTFGLCLCPWVSAPVGVISSDLLRVGNGLRKQ